MAKSVTNKFITFGNSISAVNRSFVVVCEFSFDDTLTIVPTLQEAYDYIEMEEIERQVDINFKSDGVISFNEFKYNIELKVGDTSVLDAFSCRSTISFNSL